MNIEKLKKYQIILLKQYQQQPTAKNLQKLNKINQILFDARKQQQQERQREREKERERKIDNKIIEKLR